MRPLHPVGVIRLPNRSAAALGSGLAPFCEEIVDSTTISRLVSQAQERPTYVRPTGRRGDWPRRAGGSSSKGLYAAGYSVIAANTECLKQQLAIAWERLRKRGVADPSTQI